MAHKKNTIKSQSRCGFFHLVCYPPCKTASAGKKNGRSVTVREGKGWGSNSFTIALLLLIVFSSHHALANTNCYPVDVPQQNAADAINELAQQTQAKVLFSYHLAHSRQAQPIKGCYSLERALRLLLKHTGLRSGLSDQGVMTITDATNTLAYQHNDKGDEAMGVTSKKKILAGVIGFFAGASAQGVYAQADDEGSVWALEEVVVTAQKRETSLQDTAMAITALGADEIDKKNLVSMDDYLRNIPGVSFQDRGAGQSSIVIRGMATDPQSSDSTAGAYFGETPIADIGSASQSGSAGNADLKLVDIERVEVLRGPQGTLYGSGSMAGTVRIVPNAPKLDTIEGSIATRLSNTAEAGGDNTSVQGVLNIPLVEDKLALRAVAYRIDNSGYIDNVAASEPTDRVQEFIDNDGVVVKDVGDRGNNTTTGFRLAALWQLTDQLDATLTYINQDIEQDGLPEVELDVGKYKQVRWQNGENQNQNEFIESELELVNLVLNYDVGWADITSSSSWIDNDAAIGMNSSSTAHFRDNTAPFDLFVQELRLSSQWDGALQLISGLYYEDREKEVHTYWAWTGDPSLNPYPDPELPRSKFDRVRQTKQKAFFGELAYQISEQWEATLGGRYFDYEIDEVNSLIVRASVRYQDRQEFSEETGQTFKGALSYTPNDNILVYGNWAQGFRIGRAQNESVACAASGVSVPGIESDTTENLELGLKSNWNDGRITFNATVYQTDWDDIPIALVTPAVAPFINCFRLVNAGKAQSTGVELELRALVMDNLQLDISASTVDATLEEDSSVGDKGDDLPGSADYNANIGLEYDFILGDYPSFVRIDYAYVGEYYNNTAETGTPAGDFGQVHVKVGTTIGQVDVDLFANNLTNDDGLTWVESDFQRFSGTSSAYRIRPRTIGISLGYQF